MVWLRIPTLGGTINFAKRTFQVLCAWWVTNEYLLEPRITHGASMLPTFRAETSLILASRWPPSLRPSNLKLGDLIIARTPADGTKEICKRIMGLPGDTICVDPSGSALGYDGLEDAKGKVHLVVPRGHIWLAGDNMSASQDSRMVGPVSMNAIKAKPLLRIWPLPFMLYRNPLRYIEDEE